MFDAVSRMDASQSDTLQLAGACSQQLDIPSLDITVQELKRLISECTGVSGTSYVRLVLYCVKYADNNKQRTQKKVAAKASILYCMFLQVCQTGLT